MSKAVLIRPMETLLLYGLLNHFTPNLLAIFVMKEKYFSTSSCFVHINRCLVTQTSIKSCNIGHFENKQIFDLGDLGHQKAEKWLEIFSFATNWIGVYG